VITGTDEAEDGVAPKKGRPRRPKGSTTAAGAKRGGNAKAGTSRATAMELD